MNMTLLGKIRCMLSNASISKYFLAEALAYACYLVNKLSSSVIGGKTSFESLIGKSCSGLWFATGIWLSTYYHIKEDK